MTNETNVTLEIDPNDELDLSIEHERELLDQARIPVLQSGFRSLREFQIAALEALVKKQTARGAKKVRAA